MRIAPAARPAARQQLALRFDALARGGLLGAKAVEFLFQRCGGCFGQGDLGVDGGHAAVGFGESLAQAVARREPFAKRAECPPEVAAEALQA